MFPRSQDGMCVCFFRWHHLSSYSGDLQDFRFQMAPNGIPLKKQIIESSNKIASGNRCKANIRSLLLPLLLEFIQAKNIYGIEIFLLLSSKKKHNLRGQLLSVSCRTSSLGTGFPFKNFEFQVPFQIEGSEDTSN